MADKSMTQHAFDAVRRMTVPPYSYDLGKDGSVWLMSPEFRACRWSDMDSFLFGKDYSDFSEFSIFDIVTKRLYAVKAGMDSAKVDGFCLDNAWMSRLAGCGSVEELMLKLTALEPGIA